MTHPGRRQSRPGAPVDVGAARATHRAEVLDALGWAGPRPDGFGDPAVLELTVLGLIAAKRSGDQGDDEDTRDDHHGGLQA